MKEHSMVKIGTTQNQRKLFYNLKKEMALLDQMGTEPTTKMLAQRLDVPEQDVEMMKQRMSGADIILDQPLTNESGSSLRMDLETDTTEVDRDEDLAHKESLALLIEKIDELRAHLNEKELYILESRLLADPPKTLQDIGNEWGVTREAVRQMETRVMKKLKKEFINSLNENI